MFYDNWNCPKLPRGNTLTNKSQLVLIFFLIVWENGSSLLNQSQAVIKQNQNKRKLLWTLIRVCKESKQGLKMITSLICHLPWWTWVNLWVSGEMEKLTADNILLSIVLNSDDSLFNKLSFQRWLFNVTLTLSVWHWLPVIERMN